MPYQHALPVIPCPRALICSSSPRCLSGQGGSKNAAASASSSRDATFQLYPLAAPVPPPGDGVDDDLPPGPRAPPLVSPYRTSTPPRALVPSYARALALPCPRAEDAGDGQGDSGDENDHEFLEERAHLRGLTSLLRFLPPSLPPSLTPSLPPSSSLPPSLSPCLSPSLPLSLTRSCPSALYVPAPLPYQHASPCPSTLIRPCPCSAVPSCRRCR